MEERLAQRLSRLFVASTVTIGALSAVLVWQLEHFRSFTLTLAIVAAGVVVCIYVFRGTSQAFTELARHFDALLRVADQQSRSAEAAARQKDEFLATLSHELRTPLNAVLGWARLLDSGKLNAEQSVRAVRAIERAGWAQARIVEDLLELSQIVGGRIQLAPRATSLQTVIAGVVQSLEAGATAKQVTIAMRVDETMPLVLVDPDRVRQMLWHLVSNAIKFTPREGCVEVGASTAADHLQVWVSDTGVGFSPDVAAHLFERFRQGDSSSTRAYGGLGLGLGMVRHLAELHGGHVTASSDGPGRGSRFEVQLPLRTAERPEGQSADELSLKGTTVLAVDDDPAALDFTRHTLERFGARVVTAVSTAQALACLEHETVDVVLSDLRMPEADGLDLIQRIRNRPNERGQIPAAAVTAMTRADDRSKALDAGFQAHIAKPVDPLELAATVAWLTQQDPGEHDAPLHPAT